MKKYLCSTFLLFVSGIQLLHAEDGYRFWLRYDKVSDQTLPAGAEQPDHTLDYYKTLQFQFVPGSGGNN